MKQRIILSEKQRTPQDTPHEHPFRRSTRFPERRTFGATPQDRTNRGGRNDHDLGSPQPFYARNGIPRRVSPSSASSQFPPGSLHPEKRFQDHATNTQATTNRQGGKGALEESASFDNFVVNVGNLDPTRKSPSNCHTQRSFCLNGAFESACSSKRKFVLHLLCTVGLIILAIYLTSSNADFGSHSRSILYDALPWVFRVTNISAQETRARALWENHIVLSNDNRILIPETFESRWNVEVAPLLENQFHRMWNELPRMQCLNGENAFAAFSLQESESLPVTVSFEKVCNHDTLPGSCTQERQIHDLRQLTINLPSKSSRSSYSINIAMKRPIRPTDASIDPDVMVGVVKGVVHFHLSDSSKIALVRYCDERRQHFSDSITQGFTPSNNIKHIISMYELKRMYALISKNRRGVSYFTELWDANELSTVVLDPVEHSWHPQIRTNVKRSRLRREDFVSGQHKLRDAAENIANDGETDAISSELGNSEEKEALKGTELFRDASNATNSSLEVVNKKNTSDVSELASSINEYKNESTLSESVPGQIPGQNDEQRETPDEDENYPDLPSDADESDDDDDSTTENQSQDEGGEVQLSGNARPDEQHSNTKQEPKLSETGESAPTTRPLSVSLPQYARDRDILSDPRASGVAQSQPASIPHSQMNAEDAGKMIQEHSSQDQMNPLETSWNQSPTQNSLSGLRNEEPNRIIPRRANDFPQSSQNDHPSQKSASSVENADGAIEYYQSSQSSPRGSDRVPPLRDGSLQVGSAEHPMGNVQSAPGSSRVPYSEAVRTGEQHSQTAPVPIRRAEPSHEQIFPGRRYPTRQTGIPRQPQVRIDSRRFSPRMTDLDAHQENHMSDNLPSSKKLDRPHAQPINGIHNHLPSRKESHLQIHGRSPAEPVRDGRATADSRATARTQHHGEQIRGISTLQDGILYKDTSSQRSMTKQPQKTGPYQDTIIPSMPRGMRHMS